MFEIYSGKKVFITGHTGFKGSWLASWLESMGAEVAGYSLPPNELSHFNLIKLSCKNYFENINDETTLNKSLKDFKPDIVFHLAAQPLVNEGYKNPLETYNTNVLGSLKVYQASLNAGVGALVSITTDKVYENFEWVYPYRENDPLGGHDPYSSSKACVELMTQSFRKSFLSLQNSMLLATTRAGNVIGGGDWADGRIIPDLIQSTQTQKVVAIRNPQSVRPWQHVLEPLRGYLMVGEKLLKGNKSFAKAYNFGPNSNEAISVGEVCTFAKSSWSDIKYEFIPNLQTVHEANLLMLDISLAQNELNWKPIMNFKDTVQFTVDWYKSFYLENTLSTQNQIKEFENLVKAKGSH